MALIIENPVREFFAANGLSVGAGVGADVDTAWDNLQSELPSGSALAFADPASIRPMLDDPEPLTVALSSALLGVGEAAAGEVLAWPVAPRSAFTRRSVRFVVEDPEVEAPEGDVPLFFSQHLLLALAAQLGEPREGETLEDARVVARVARYKPVSVKGSGATAAEWVVLDGPTKVLGGFRTSGDAKKAAVARVREAQGHSTGRLDIVKVSAKESGPVWTVARQRVKQRIRLQVTWVTPKKSPLPCAGWVFCSRATAS